MSKDYMGPRMLTDLFPPGHQTYSVRLLAEKHLPVVRLIASRTRIFWNLQNDRCLVGYGSIWELLIVVVVCVPLVSSVSNFLQ